MKDYYEIEWSSEKTLKLWRYGQGYRGKWVGWTAKPTCPLCGRNDFPNERHYAVHLEECKGMLYTPDEVRELLAEFGEEP